MTNAIEQTRITMYDAFNAMKAGGRWLIKKENCEAFESALEAHLEEQRKELCRAFGALGRMTQERDDIQGRLHAIDHAYCEQSNQLTKLSMDIGALERTVRLSGEELMRVQGIARQHLDDATQAGSIIRANKIEIESLRGQLEARDKTIGELRNNYGRDREDLMSAEKLSDSLDEQLRDAQSVIGKQEQLIHGQRLAIADLYLSRKNNGQIVFKKIDCLRCGAENLVGDDQTLIICWRCETKHPLRVSRSA